MSDQPPNSELGALRRQVEENPTDLLFRFQLGECLFRSGQYREAIAQLQKSRMNPNCRAISMRVLANAYEALGLHDLASKTRAELRREFPGDDGPGGAGVPARLNPIRPVDTSAAKKLPPNEEENA